MLARFTRDSRYARSRTVGLDVGRKDAGRRLFAPVERARAATRRDGEVLVARQLGMSAGTHGWCRWCRWCGGAVRAVRADVGGSWVSVSVSVSVSPSPGCSEGCLTPWPAPCLRRLVGEGVTLSRPSRDTPGDTPPTHPDQRSKSHVKGGDVAIGVCVRGDASPRDDATSYRSQVRPLPVQSPRLRLPHSCTNTLKGTTTPRHAALTALPSAITLAACAKTTTVLKPISSARLVQASTNRSALSCRSRRVSPLREGKRVEV
jgi:hypothetical protein